MRTGDVITDHVHLCMRLLQGNSGLQATDAIEHVTPVIATVRGGKRQWREHDAIPDQVAVWQHAHNRIRLIIEHDGFVNNIVPAPEPIPPSVIT
jgi:hypothetical protein